MLLTSVKVILQVLILYRLQIANATPGKCTNLISCHINDIIIFVVYPINCNPISVCGSKTCLVTETDCTKTWILGSERLHISYSMPGGTVVIWFDLASYIKFEYDFADGFQVKEYHDGVETGSTVKSPDDTGSYTDASSNTVNLIMEYQADNTMKILWGSLFTQEFDFLASTVESLGVPVGSTEIFIGYVLTETSDCLELKSNPGETLIL